MPTVTRRTLLIAGLATAAAGCSGHQDAPRPTPIPTPTKRVPDPQLADIVAEARLVLMYESAVRAHPSLKTMLEPIRAQHATHQESLIHAVGARPSVTVAPRIPAAAAAVLAALRAAELASAARATTSCLSAASDRAGLLGSIAASEQCHLLLLHGTPSVAPPGAVPAGRSSDELAGLQTVLQAENAVRWGYDIVGGQVHTALQPAVRTIQAGHVSVLSLLESAIQARHATPDAPEAAYTLPFVVAGQTSALRLAATLEDRSTAAWRYLLGSTDNPALRRFAATGLRDAAVRAAQWRGRIGSPTSPALPGT
jgi:hypothetical protein